MNFPVLVLADPTEQPLRSYVPGERTAGEALAQLDCRPCLLIQHRNRRRGLPRSNGLAFLF